MELGGKMFSKLIIFQTIEIIEMKLLKYFLLPKKKKIVRNLKLTSFDPHLKI